MRPRFSIFIAASLDGFIARADGHIDWLGIHALDQEPNGYDEFIHTVDAIVIGRRTYETALGFGGWVYHDKRVIVLAHGARESRHGEEFHSGDPRGLLPRLAGCKRVYVDGGKVISQFFAADLIDDVTVGILPIVLGGGIRLFPVGKASTGSRSSATASTAVAWCSSSIASGARTGARRYPVPPGSERVRRDGFAGFGRRLPAVSLAELRAGGVVAARFAAVRVAPAARVAFEVGRAAARAAAVIAWVTSASRRAPGFGFAGFGFAGFSAAGSSAAGLPAGARRGVAGDGAASASSMPNSAPRPSLASTRAAAGAAGSSLTAAASSSSSATRRSVNSSSGA